MFRIAAMRFFFLSRFFFSHYFAVSDEVDLNSIADAKNVLAESILARQKKNKEPSKLKTFCSVRFSEIVLSTTEKRENPFPSPPSPIFLPRNRDKEMKERFARHRDEETAVFVDRPPL